MSPAALAASDRALAAYQRASVAVQERRCDYWEAERAAQRDHAEGAATIAPAAERIKAAIGASRGVVALPNERWAEALDAQAVQALDRARERHCVPERLAALEAASGAYSVALDSFITTPAPDLARLQYKLVALGCSEEDQAAGEGAPGWVTAPHGSFRSLMQQPRFRAALFADLAEELGLLQAAIDQPDNNGAA